MIFRSSFTSLVTLRSLVPVFAATLLACGSGGEAHAVTASPPSEVVLQYVGAYTGVGSVSALELRRDGTFDATIDGAAQSGTFVGPSAPSKDVAIAIELTAGSTAFKATVPAEWTPQQRLVVTRGSLTETLTSTWSAASEQLCDDSHGHWTDDDVDPVKGLSCDCDAPYVFIPSQGGCIR